MSNAEVRGRFVWHELLTTDTAAAAAFYPRIMPWRTQPSNMPGYTIFMSGQSQVAGLMALPGEAGAAPAHWLMYVGTAHVDATCAQAQSLGARVCKAPTDIPNVGRFAVLADPQGATFAVFTPDSASPPAAPAFGGFSWHELATTDVTGALRFYGELFGWKKGVGHDMGAMGVYQLFEHGGMTVGGMCGTQGPSTPPSWLSYVHVADSSRAVGAVRSAGGRLLHGPVEVPGGSWIALFMDPQGGAFAVHEMPRATSQPAPAGAATAATRKPPLKVAATAAARRPPAAKSKAVRKKKAAAKKAPARAAAKRSARKAKKVVRRAKKTVRRVKRVVRRSVRRAARKK
jgi:predicted enzyme related to lactoylglutathione lyase